MFRCKVCSWLHAGDTPPDVCPSCGSPADRFRPVATGLGEPVTGSMGRSPGARLRLLAFVPATIDSPFARHDGPRLDVVTGDSAWFDDNIPCMRACPVNTDVATYIGHVAGGAFGLAAQLNREQNVFAGTLGRTCSRPCEDACRRTVIDSPIQIRALKRVATDHEAMAPARPRNIDIPELATGRRIAIVGAGVAGLTVARQLRMAGNAVTVFERDQAPGGLMVSGVPPWRLPRGVAETDIATITSLGVTVETGRELGRDLSVADLSAGYDAVVVATGAQAVARLPGTRPIDHADLPNPAPGVIDGLAFLRHVAGGGQRPAGPVVVVGGGYTAFDCARTARRLAPGPVTVAMRQSAAMSVAADELSEAQVEGVIMLDGLAFTDVVRDGDEVTAATFRDDAGAERTISCSLLIGAIGQEPDWSVIEPPPGAGTGDLNGLTVAPDGRLAEWPNVWLAGDVIDGSTSFIDAIASGRRTTTDIERWLGQQGVAPTGGSDGPPPVPLDLDRPAMGVETSGDDVPAWTRGLLHRRVIEDEPYRAIDRQSPAVVDVTSRGLESGNPAVETVSGMTVEIGEKESARCLQCQANIHIDGDRCILCNGCVDVCPYGCIEMLGLDRLATVDGSGLDDLPGFDRQTVAMLIDEDSCIRCGKCVDWCPTACLTMSAHRPTLGGQVTGFDIRSLLAGG